MNVFDYPKICTETEQATTSNTQHLKFPCVIFHLESIKTGLQLVFKCPWFFTAMSASPWITPQLCYVPHTVPLIKRLVSWLWWGCDWDPVIPQSSLSWPFYISLHGENETWERLGHNIHHFSNLWNWWHDQWQ